ncbi:DUF4468 domain-containing protein [Pedobacter sp. Leaf170]|uniref:DUF4468 domain-containing protein n=1 Tax=Pedobacter sp. Leaf170 TaxID=2876558 RepID=UPI001E58B68A|nr:DUF4468 domain-containing protein [Pedobacter sp. Leaf170]
MKKTILILMLSVVCTSAFSQSFKLTPNGFVNAADTTKNYVVIDVPNKKQTDLYKSSLLYFSKLYVSPKEVMTLIENQSIILNGVEKQAVKMKVLYLNPSWDINHTSNYEFKDDKVKVNFNINKISTYTGDIFREKTMRDFFNKRGEVKDEKAIKSIEEYFNQGLKKYAESLTSQKSDW